MNGSTSSRAPIYAGIALVAVLLIGGAAGYWFGTQAHMKRAGPIGGSPMTMLGLTRQTLHDSLRLSPAQAAVIDSVLERARQEADSSVRQMVTDVREATARAKSQVRDALDETQRVRLDSLLNRTTPMLPRTPMLPSRP